MKLGTERIWEIVLSLRNFCRLDESEKKSVNIETGIDSTLLFLQHRLEAKGNWHIEIYIPRRKRSRILDRTTYKIPIKALITDKRR